MDVGTPSVPGTPQDRLFTTGTVGGRDVQSAFQPEFQLESGTPLPRGLRSGRLPSENALSTGRQHANLTIRDLTDVPPAVSQQVQRRTDLTVTGVNLAAPFSGLAADQVLRLTGQEDNPLVATPARGAALGLAVGTPISLASGRVVPAAFVAPTLQSIAAEAITAGVVSVLPQPAQQALVEACSDENRVVNAAKWFACNVGQNPDTSPPPPPPSAGGAVVQALPATGAVDVYAQLQDVQRELLADRGVRADTAAQVLNNLSEDEVVDRFGLPEQDVLRVLQAEPSNEVGQKVVGPAIVGPAIVGPAIVGPAVVGPRLVGEGIVGDCLDESCDNWGRINGLVYPGTPVATSNGAARTSGGYAPAPRGASSPAAASPTAVPYPEPGSRARYQGPVWQDTPPGAPAAAPARPSVDWQAVREGAGNVLKAFGYVLSLPFRGVANQLN